MRYVFSRIIAFLLTLVTMSLIIFMILALAPGDPMGAFALDPTITDEMRRNIRSAFGLDQPLHMRYIKWLYAFVQGNMGYSFTSHSPVALLIYQRIGTTLWIVGTSYVISIAIALPLGVYAAYRAGTWFDHLVTVLSLLGFSLPSFIMAIVVLLLFSVHLRWLPFIYHTTITTQTTGWHMVLAQVKQSLLPICVLVFFHTASLVRFVRTAILEQLTHDYVTAARARGVREVCVVTRHITRNAMIPVVTLIALSLPTIFTGAIVTEEIFRVPGIGSLLIHAIEANDTPVVMAITMIYGILVVVFNGIADVVYGLLDPRIRRQ